MEEKLELKVKLRKVLTGQRAVWTTAEQNKLPDNSFAYICEGGKKDSDGKTTPRSLRKLVYKDADGKIDLAHTKNALARLNQVECDGKVISQEIQDKIRSRLQKALAQAKKSLKSISYSRTITGVSMAFDLEFGDIKASDNDRQHYVSEVLDDAVIVDSWDEWDTYYKVTYIVKDNIYTFTPREEWIKGDYQFTAKKPIPKK